MALTRLIGLITSSIIFLSILTGHHFVFPAHITSTPPTNDSSEYVVISADDYVPGLHDYHGDPCTGAALYEGDIALPLIINPDTNTSYILLPPSYSTEERAKRGAISNSNQLWPNAIVYYTFDSSIIDSVKLQIYESMHHWEELTCIRFRVRTTERDYIEFFKGAGCCSYVGNLRGGRQKISIGQYCKSLSIITHEIGHVIGFWHEMNRPDRDEHVRIVTSNIPAYYLFNFRKLPQYYINSRGFVYDYNSVMHYYPKAFTKNSEDTIEPIQEGIPIGPENGLTELDANQTKAMYNCQQYGDRGSTVPSSATPPPEQSFSPNCGSHLMGFSGAFSFDAAKNGRSLCEWLIKAPIGYSIRLVIDMVLPGRTGSCTNGVEVIDGHQLQGRPHGKYCGNFRGYIFLSTYNYMLVKMHVGNRALGGRFTARFSTEDVDECSRYYDSICANGCQNTPGGFTCICEDGYYVSRNKIRCFDINECAYDNGGCSHKCVNTGGSYICNCNQGYALSGDKKTCFIGTAEEQCRNNNGNCEHNCVVSGNTYSCSCNAGYSLYTDNRRCIDVNECSSNPCPDSFECVNNLGSYTCSCPTGFVQSGDECVDINECNQGTHLCSQTCFNSIGSYRCGCNAGYQLSSATACEDFNECSSPSTNTCSDREKCLNLRGAYYCYCRTGFLLSDSNACVDVDECLRGLCDHKCENTVGAYICSCDSGFSLYRDRRSCSKSGCVAGTSGCRCIYSGNSCNCLDGYKLGNAGVFCQAEDQCRNNNGNCEHNCVVSGNTYSCSCNAGYSLYTDNRRCLDVNECSSNPCPDSFECVNNLGSYTCSCPTGFVQSGNQCIDEDECTIGTDLCEQGCINTEGSYYCVCPAGFQISGRYGCTDINECISLSCGRNQYCVNTEGSYSCECHSGFFKNQRNDNCDDINECNQGTHLCNQTCFNSIGSYRCGCNAGYQLSSATACEDVDECGARTCLDNQFCVNSIGSYTCQCIFGYKINLDTRACQDIDECSEGTHFCAHNCINDVGSYHCGCNEGYVASGTYGCTDFNECSSPSTNTCSDREKCLNLRGAYYCYCRTGFLLSDSNACVDVDECLRGLCDHKCENTVGAYICSCDSGFSLYRDRRSCSKSGCVAGTSGCRCIYSGNSCNCLDGYKLGNAGVFCQDIDECEVNNGGCSHTCSNTHGSSQCSCPSGLELSWNAKSCIQIATCSEFNGGCEQICEETTTPGVRCLCRNDYVLSEDRKSCEDINECAYDNGGCSHKCVNTGGSYICNCNQGYALSGDKKTCFIGTAEEQCRNNNGNCEHNCVVSGNTYSCSCNAGYSLYTDNRRCIDVNECSSNPCPDSFECVNNLGSYTCSCPTGFVQSGDECVDINECNQGTHLCSQTCFNSIGSYRCGCNAGYQLSSATACEDFNECSSPSTNTCSDREKCLNLRGGYYCYCRTGFLLSDSNACVDVDECLRGLCDHKCENTVGAYICSCDSGFSLYRDRRSCSKSGCVAGTSGCRCIYSGNSCNCLDGYKLGNAGVFCQDIDECEVNNGGCSHTCSNTHGSSQCSCPSGLELSWNAKSCIPTCSEFNGGCEQICEETTTPGVRCLCREDYVLSEDRKSCEVRTACHANGGCHHICTEEDGRAQCSCRSNYQLAADQTSCSRNFNCTDSRICGHFCDTSTSTCACKEGFGLGSNGRTCEDIDECAFPHLSNCSSSCVNTDGSYICICPQGYWIGSDGKTCRENSLGCGGNAFSSSYGSLPKITGPYPIQCVWSITVPQNELAVFRIYYLTFGSPNSCTGFSVEAWDTRAPNNTQVGKQCIGAYEVYFSAAGNTLEIRIDVERDYDPYYEFFYFGVNNNNIFGSSICDQSISLGRNFSSPNFPLSYSSNSDCSIYITSQITPFYVKFYFLNLEWSEDCERDSITIRDVHNYNTRPLAKLCGNRVPEPIRSETIHFSLVFQSDSSVQRGGFYATTYID